MYPSNARITAIGTYVPEKVLNNTDLEQIVETNDEWIVKRTGIKERRIAQDNEFTSDLCFGAVENLIKHYQKDVSDVDMVIVCTNTPDYAFPSVASMVQNHFNIEAAGAMDLNATCAGFAYGLHVANGLITSGLHRKIIVIGADALSKTTDYTDRTSCILFGDGAGAVLIEADEGNGSFLASHQASDGKGGIHLYRTGLSNIMNGQDLIDTNCIIQNGREVYKWAVTQVPLAIQKLIDKSELTLDQIDWFIPHSANLRIIESICERSGFPMNKTLYSLEYYGNTSAATIPLSLELGIQEEKVSNGDSLLLYGFGGGLVHAGVVLRWNPDPRVS